MKRILIILGLFATVTTFAQSPRIKLNQITKDTVTGSVLISSPTDSGMVYSRDLFISYGTDTFLILGGDTLAATSSIISSVLSDGVTITGDGTTGSELTVDTATVIATKGDLSDYVNISGTETITGAKTFTTSLTVNERIFVNAGNGNQLYLNNNGEQYTQITFANNSSATKGALYYDNSNSLFEMYAASGNGLAFHSSAAERMRITSGGNVGIGTSSPSEKLEVNGKVKIGDLTGTGGNAVYENGGVLGVASDSRFKSYIGDIDNGIQKVLDLRPKYFVDNRNSTFQQLGFYAQEVKSIINEASYPIGNTDYLGINDRAIIAVTVKAIQEQQAIIESQATEIETLKSQIQLILNEIEQLKNN